MKPYMKPGLLWEDPLDGTGPKAHGKKRRKSQRRKLRSHKKGERQRGREEATSTSLDNGASGYEPVGLAAIGATL